MAVSCSEQDTETFVIVKDVFINDMLALEYLYVLFK